MKVGLCLLPYFSGTASARLLLPHLGLATLSAHLRNRDVDVTVIDLRPEAEHLATDHISLITEGRRFVSETPTLELLVPLLERYMAGCSVEALLAIDHESREYRRYADDHQLNPAAMSRSLEEVHGIVQRSLPRLGGFDVVGFTTYMTNTYAVFLACAALRLLHPGQTIIVGGPEVTQSENTARLFLLAGLADAVIPGDALTATATAIETCRTGKPLSGALGVLVSNGNADPTRTPPAPPLPIDELPFPDYSDLDPDSYLRFSYPIATSRGCPFCCSFCSEKDLFGRYRRMSTATALRHLEHLTQTQRCRHIYFGDSLLNVGDDWLIGLAEGMVERGIEAGWEGYLRAGSSRASLHRMKRAGLSRAVIGIESISDELLATMNKAQASRTNLGTIEAFMAEGLSATLTLIVGFPGEEAADSRELVQLLERLSGHNEKIERTLRAAYGTMGFRALPSRRVPDIGAFPLPFFLKPMSEIYDSPRGFGLQVTPYGDRFSGSSLPERVKTLIAAIPRTFESDGEPTREVYMRQLNATEVPGTDGRVGAFVQHVHTYFHGFSEEDHFTIRRPAVFESTPGGENGDLRYRSLKVGMEISCHQVADTAVERLRGGATLGELKRDCTPGSRSAEIELKHLLAVASVEESVGVTIEG